MSNYIAICPSIDTSKHKSDVSTIKYELHKEQTSTGKYGM